MNKVILMGRLTRDPEVRYSQNDTSMAIARYSLAVDRRFARRNEGSNEQTVDFINCVAFGKSAEFAEKSGFTILQHYIDRAYSATTDNRPEFQRMIKDSDKKLFDVIIVWKLDRFSRNRYDSAKYKNQLNKKFSVLFAIIHDKCRGGK